MLIMYLSGLICRETTIPEKSSLVGSTTAPSLPLHSLSHEKNPSSSDQGATRLASTEHFRSPDFSHVLYNETYDEFTREKCPAVPVSHCWTSKQTIYVGCKDGQLLLVDFEMGTIKVIANPYLFQVSTYFYWNIV